MFPLDIDEVGQNVAVGGGGRGSGVRRFFADLHQSASSASQEC